MLKKAVSLFLVLSSVSLADMHNLPDATVAFQAAFKNTNE